MKMLLGSATCAAGVKSWAVASTSKWVEVAEERSWNIRLDTRYLKSGGMRWNVI
jgi:hypothetical protein